MWTRSMSGSFSRSSNSNRRRSALFIMLLMFVLMLCIAALLFVSTRDGRGYSRTQQPLVCVRAFDQRRSSSQAARHGRRGHRRRHLNRRCMPLAIPALRRSFAGVVMACRACLQGVVSLCQRRAACGHTHRQHLPPTRAALHPCGAQTQKKGRTLSPSTNWEARI